MSEEKIDTTNIDRYVAEAIRTNNSMVSELIADYLKRSGQTYNSICLVEDRRTEGKTCYYIGQKPKISEAETTLLRECLPFLNEAYLHTDDMNQPVVIDLISRIEEAVE